MNIVWLTSEAHPYAKTGGLADVSSALPKALAERGHKVSVIMPYYPQVTKKYLKDIKPVKDLLGVPFGSGEEWAQIHEHKINSNLSFYFIEFNNFYDRPTLYDWNGVEFSDNAERFIFFSRAAMQAILALKIKPDILHTNDWHAALANVYLHSPLYWDSPNFKKTKSVMTIHNIGYQGVFAKSNMYWTGLSWDYFNFHCLEFYDQINLLKAGISIANMVNTVSPNYATEILSNEFSFNLEGPLQNAAAHGRLRGIINGIDVDEWNPETDKLIPENFSSNSMNGKKACKKALQKQLALPQKANTPLFGLVSRLAYQKGLDVFVDAAERLLPYNDIQFAVVGSGDQWLEGRLKSLHEQFPDKFGLFIGYDDKLAHLIEAGSDSFIMPSRYEPCGLNQMYSMRYGTLPLVRATGGLDDTVRNYSPGIINNATGFKFWDLTIEALTGTIEWAADTYMINPKAFKQMQRNGMEIDFSWDHTAAEYEMLYEDAHRKL